MIHDVYIKQLIRNYDDNVAAIKGLLRPFARNSL